MVWSELGQQGKALADYSEALKIKSDYPEVLNNRGGVLRRMGRRREALADFTAALRYKPDLGNAYFMADKWAQARDAWITSLQIERIPQTLYNLGNLEYYEGNYQIAAEHLEEALSTTPDAYQYVGKLAFILSQIPERHAEVEPLFSTAIRLA